MVVKVLKLASPTSVRCPPTLVPMPPAFLSMIWNTVLARGLVVGLSVARLKGIRLRTTLKPVTNTRFVVLT